MAKQLWFPKADRSQTYDTKYPGMVADRIDVALLHSTEGSSWPNYNGGASAPNMTINFDYANKKVLYRQHFQANRSSRALAGSVNGLSTNRFHVFQIEIVGTSGWASSENPRAPYRLRNDQIVKNFADWQLEGIAEVLRWLRDEWEVPMVAPFKFVPWQRDNRMTAAQWSAFKGVCGHQHVPANDHTDPGEINIVRLLELVRNPLGSASVAKPVPPKPIPSTPTKEIINMDKKELFDALDEYAVEVMRGKRGLSVLQTWAAIPWQAAFGKKPNTKGDKASDWYRPMEVIEAAIAKLKGTNR